MRFDGESLAYFNNDKVNTRNTHEPHELSASAVAVLTSEASSWYLSVSRPLSSHCDNRHR